MVIKGQKLNDRYEIIRSIGEGGMANVYLAHDTLLNRNVAIKILRGDLANDEKFVRRFQREALSASSLSHPNIVQMYDVGEDNGNYYIVMEYVEGKTLKQLLKKRGSLTLSESIDIMLQLTDGMAHAHDSYIIHRDLKPQNIMIQDDGMIKITDFGIAMALNSTQLTQTNSVMGSVHYLPPEQASGKGSTIKSDIYSMGIIFYELLTGILPFKGDNAVEIALKHMKDPLPSVRKQNPAIPQSVENVIMRATAKNPKNRYNDAKEMHQDLLTALNEERINEPRLVYKYPEHDIEETKVLPVIKESVVDTPQTSEEEIIATPIDGEEEVVKKTNKWIIILSVVLGLIGLGLLVFFLIVPMLTEVPDITVPDVTNYSVIDAEKALKDKGFEVNTTIEKIASDEVEKGKVVKTDPQKGRSIKKGTVVTIYESLGQESYEVEDFTGKNYIEIETLLKTLYGIDVSIEKKDVDLSAKEYNSQEIVDQSVKKGEKLVKGDKITLYIPNIVETYPDMVEEAWTKDDVEAFAKKYNLKVTYEEKETKEYPVGTVVSQSRSAKTPIVDGATLKVVIAIEPKVSTNPGGDQEEVKPESSKE